MMSEVTIMASIMKKIVSNKHAHFIRIWTAFLQVFTSANFQSAIGASNCDNQLQAILVTYLCPSYPVMV